MQRVKRVEKETKRVQAVWMRVTRAMFAFRSAFRTFYIQDWHVLEACEQKERTL